MTEALIQFRTPVLTPYGPKNMYSFLPVGVTEDERRSHLLRTGEKVVAEFGMSCRVCGCPATSIVQLPDEDDIVPVREGVSECVHLVSLCRQCEGELFAGTGIERRLYCTPDGGVYEWGEAS